MSFNRIILAAALLLSAGASVQAQKVPETVKSQPSTPGTVVRPPNKGGLAVSSNPAGALVEVFAGRGKKPVSVARTTDSTGADFTLSRGTYRVVVTMPEYEPGTSTVSVKPGATESMVVTLRPTFSYLSLTGPSLDGDSTVKLDGLVVPFSSMLRDSPEAIRIKTRPGGHDLRVERKSFVPFESKVVLIPGDNPPVPVILEPMRATLVILAEPRSRVYVDGEAKGTVGETGRLVVDGLSPDAPNDLRVELEDHVPFVGKATLNIERETSVTAKLAWLPTSGRFEDIFMDLSLWSAPSTWTAAEGVLEVKGPRAVGMPKDVRYADMDLAFNLRLVDPRGAAWVLRARDEQNYYLFYLTGPGSPWPNQLRTYIVRNGAIDLARTAIPPLPVIPGLKVGESYAIQVRAVGDSITTDMTPSSTGTEVRIGFFRDANRTYPLGDFGFATLDGESFQVNVLVAVPQSGK